MEFTLNNVVYCVLCERLPEKLDNEIKLQHLEWHEACGRLTPAQIAGCIPHCVPKANLCQKSRITGISRFNFAKWRAEGEPTLLRGGWIALCRLIAENSQNPESFRNIITLCNDLAIDNEENPALKASMTMSKGRAAAGKSRRLVLPRHPMDPEDLVVWFQGAKQPPPPPPLAYAPPPPPQPPLPEEPPPPKL